HPAQRRPELAGRRRRRGRRRWRRGRRRGSHRCGLLARLLLPHLLLLVLLLLVGPAEADDLAGPLALGGQHFLARQDRDAVTRPADLRGAAAARGSHVLEQEAARGAR